MKKKYICIFLILIIIALFIFLTFYKANYYKSNLDDSVLQVIDVKDDKKIITKDIKDIEKYYDNIILKDILEYDYIVSIDGESIPRKIYIDKDKYLYLSDKNSSYKISNIKMKTMYVEDKQTNDILLVYLISEKNKMYVVSLSNNIDIKNIEIDEINSNVPIANFTNIIMKGDPNNTTLSKLIVSTNGNIYDAVSELEYEETMYYIDDKYYIYGDKTIANYDGNVLKDNNNNILKFKYYIKFLEKNSTFSNSNSIIVTEDNRIIYMKDYSNELYIEKNLISKVEYTKVNEYLLKIKILLSNGSIINTECVYKNYYGFD